MLDPDAALYRKDRALVDDLLSSQPGPTDDQLVTAARLFSRYLGTEHEDLVMDLEKAMAIWGFTVVDTQGRAREIWQSGYRPQLLTTASVGSGADTTQETT